MTNRHSAIKDEAEFARLRSQIVTLESPANKGLLEESASSRSQIVTMNKGRGSNIKYLPYAFTELGVAMLSSALAELQSNRPISPADPLGSYCQKRKIHSLRIGGFRGLGYQGIGTPVIMQIFLIGKTECDCSYLPKAKMLPIVWESHIS